MAKQSINWNVVIVGGTILAGLYLYSRLKQSGGGIIKTADNYISGQTGELISDVTQPTIRTDLRQDGRSDRVFYRNYYDYMETQARQDAKVDVAQIKADTKEAVVDTRQDNRTSRVDIRQTNMTVRQQNRQNALLKAQQQALDARAARQQNRQTSRATMATIRQQQLTQVRQNIAAKIQAPSKNLQRITSRIGNTLRRIVNRR